MTKRNSDQSKAPAAKPGLKPDQQDDLKSLPLAEVEEKLGSSPDGLSQAEAEKRLTQYGPNEIYPESPGTRTNRLPKREIGILLTE
jgi:H+-transporting ATPase